MGRDFSREKLLSNLEAYASGQHAASGVDPEVAKEAVLDDLLVAFGEEGFDMYGSVQRAIETNDPDKVKAAVDEIFKEFLDTLGITVGTNDDHHLLPGEAEELLKIIVADLLDGDERITI